MGKKMRDLAVLAFAVLLALPAAAFAMLPEANARSATGEAVAAQAAEPTVASTVIDPDTRDRWTHWAAGGGDESRLSTENVGRIWTDKTVREAGDGSESDFETTLSAMSSTSDTTSLANKPLDIVLVLDASGSMADPMDNGDSTKRIDALKAAANGFIDTIAAQNANITDSAKRHQVAIVKFAGEKSDEVGNKKYQDQNRYWNNYSQIMKASGICTAGAADEFKSVVDSIEPAGATRADNGMRVAADERCASKREDAQKIVVFFTDGTPTSQQKFESDVASPAIASAKAMKDAGAVVYTVGIFSGADPNAGVTDRETSNENKFMQAVSSNYPQATYVSDWAGYSWSFGSRAESSDYYKSATNADELKKVFEGISQAITSGSGYPTETRDGYETKDGYITFTDELGDFMQVDSFTNAIIDGKEFGAAKKTTNGTTDTYEFSGAAKNLVIMVERAGSDNPQQGDKVTVKIPAALIPLREYKVDKAKGTFEVEDIGAVSPIRVVYTSSVKDMARQNLFTPDEVEGLSDYIESHRDPESDTVYFLASKWSGGELGDTVAEFEPADTNSYYYFQKDVPIYTDEACTVRATKALSGGATYYYKDEFVAQGSDGKPVDSYAIVSFPGDLAAKFEGAVIDQPNRGKALAKGTARLAYIDQLHTEKTEVGGNTTVTARDVLNPRWNKIDSIENATHVQSHLGNNGKIAFSLGTTPATLDTKAAFDLTKVLEGRDWTDTDGFTFNFELDAAKSSDLEGVDRLQGSTTVTKADVDETGAAKIDFGSFTFTRAGTYVYKVWELKGGSTREGVAYSGNAVAVTIEVTIDAAGVLHAEVTKVENPTFTNTYTAETPEDAAVIISANKTLAGRDMADGEFEFGLGYAKEAKPFDSAKNKDGAVAFAPIRYTTAAKADDDSDLVSLPALVKAGHATLGATQDGKRAWTITYVAAEETGSLPAGVSAAVGKLEIAVTVVDNGDGTLTATPDYGELGDTFKNEYRTDAESIEFEGAKKLKAEDGLTLPDIAGKFTFTVTGEPDAPMPECTSAVNDAKGGVDFGKITFTLADLNDAIQRAGDTGRTHAFVYTVTETGVVPGVTNDAQATRRVKFTVSDNGKGDLKVKREPAADISFEFTNTYGVTPVESSVADQVAATKKLTGRDLRDGEFAFELVEGTGDAAKVVATGKNDAAGKIAMSAVTYKKPGKHTYALREVNGGTESRGVTYSDAVYTVETTVTDNGDGTLKADHVLKGADEAVFENSYRVTPLETELDFGLTKQLVGRDWADGERFDFEISAAGDSLEDMPLPAQTQVSVWGRDARNGKAAVRFGKIRFTAAGIYRYEIHEVEGDLGGITYDKHIATASVTVTEDGQGNLTAAAPVVENGAFVNAYSSSLSYSASGGLHLSKALMGRDMAEGQFAFTVTPADKASAAALGLKDGGNTFAAPAAHDGETALIDVLGGRDVTFSQADVGKTFSYTVAENGEAPSGYTYDTAVRTVTIVVADNGDATLTATTTVAGGPEGEQVFIYATGKPAEKSAVVPFTNSYRASTDAPGGESATIVATKKMTGRALMDGEFTFHLAYAGTEVPLVTAHNDAAGNVDFGVLSYDTDMLAELVHSGRAHLGATAEGKRQWTVEYVAFEDTAGLPAGVSAATASFTVTVNVVDNGDGSLTATPSFSDSGPVFENVYDVDAVDMEFSGTKVLAAAEGLTPPDITGKFNFTVTGEDGAPMPERTSATNGADGSVSFGKITFTLDGLNKALEASEKPVTQGAAANESTQTATSAVGEPVNAAEDQPFTNSNDATAEQPAEEVELQSTDTDQPTGEAEQQSTESAEAQLANGAGAQGTATAVIQLNNDQADAPAETLGAATTVDAATTEASPSAQASAPTVRSHTFTYTITESGSVPGVANDPDSTRTVSFTVTDDGQGHLTVTRDPAEGAAFTFTNTYGVEAVDSSVTDQIAVTKQLTGRALAAGEFHFELVENGAVVATGTNDAGGKIAMSPISYAEPGTHFYTLREVWPDPSGSFCGVTYDGVTYTIVTTVTDKGDGTLAVTHVLRDASAAVFANAYAAKPTTVSLGAVKVLEGRKLKKGEFSFKLTGDDGSSRTAVNDARGTIDFGEFAYDAAGTYVYTVSEKRGSAPGMTYDACVYTVTVSVADNGEGSLVASVTYAKRDGVSIGGIVFHNTYVKPEEPKKPETPKTSDGPKGKRSPKAAVAKALFGLPSTGDRTTDALIVAAALAVAGAGFLIWSRRR